MKRTVTIAVSLLVVLGFAATAVAQHHHERCDRQRDELAELRTRLGDLDRQRNETIERIRVLEIDWNRDCGASRECDAFETRIVDLERREGPLAETMRRLMGALRERREETNRLTREVDRIDEAYRRDNCGALGNRVPRATFDRCNGLYNEWTRLENEINRHEQQVRELRNLFERDLRTMTALAEDISRLLSEMREHCGRHARYGEVEALERNWQEYRTFRTEIENLDRSMQHFRAVRIIQPRNVIRPEEEDRHTIHPVH